MALPVHGLALAESKRAVYQISLAPDDTADAVLEPEWWKHNSRNMRVGDRVEVVGYDRKFFGELLVVAVGKNGAGGAQVAYIMGPVDLSTQTADNLIVSHDVVWAGPVAKWRIIKGKEKTTVKDGFVSKEAAHNWLASNMLAAA